MTGNVADLPAAAAERAAHRPAIIDPDGQVTTWGALEQRVAEVAGALRAAGVRSRDRVGVMLPNSAGFAAAYWGVCRAGATMVPINPSYTPPERDHLLADSGAGWLVTDTDATVPDGVTTLATASLAGPPVGAGEYPAADHAVICYTSGTTGRPKGALLRPDNLLANLEAFSDLPLLTLEESDVLLGVLPFFHVFGLNVVLNAAARVAATVVAVDRFSPRGTAAAMAEHGVTVAYGAPPVFAALAALGPEVALPSLRAAVSGADALPVGTWERFAARFGIEIVEGYGLTETAPVLASNAAATAVRPGVVGLPLPGVRLRLVGPGGEDVAQGQVGEIWASGPNVFDGYHGRERETAEVLREGWFATGDLGAFDAAGHLTIAGRLKDMIIVSGFNVYPREVEDALLDHPDVAEAAVVGIPDERTGERVRATVVLRAGADATADDMLAHVRSRLARYKLPRDIRVVEALPRLATGKVARGALRT